MNGASERTLRSGDLIVLLPQLENGRDVIRRVRTAAAAAHMMFRGEGQTARNARGMRARAVRWRKEGGMASNGPAATIVKADNVFGLCFVYV